MVNLVESKAFQFFHTITSINLYKWSGYRTSINLYKWSGYRTSNTSQRMCFAISMKMGYMGYVLKQTESKMTAHSILCSMRDLVCMAMAHTKFHNHMDYTMITLPATNNQGSYHLSLILWDEVHLVDQTEHLGLRRVLHDGLQA